MNNFTLSMVEYRINKILQGEERITLRDWNSLKSKLMNYLCSLDWQFEDQVNICENKMFEIDRQLKEKEETEKMKKFLQG